MWLKHEGQQLPLTDVDKPLHAAFRLYWKAQTVAVMFPTATSSDCMFTRLGSYHVDLTLIACLSFVRRGRIY